MKTQVWIAISVYILVAIVKKRLDLPHSLYQILQILSVMIFEKMFLPQALTGDYENLSKNDFYNQLNLFS